MSKSIVLVDDELDIISVLSEFLEMLDHKIFQTDSANEAFKFCSENEVDIVFTDLEMPEMDGYQLSTKITDLKKDIDIYLLSGFASIIDDEKLENTGIKRVLDKPFDIMEIKRIVDEE